MDENLSDEGYVEVDGQSICTVTGSTALEPGYVYTIGVKPVNKMIRHTLAENKYLYFRALQNIFSQNAELQAPPEGLSYTGDLDVPAQFLG